jgi:polyisoprenoid-binding protein YceI
MSRFLLSLMAALLAASWVPPAAAQSEVYIIDSRHTFPSFEINHLGLSSQTGRFNTTKGRIQLDPSVGVGSLEITIDTASIDTGLKELEDELRSPNFFNVEKYPTMSFRSSKLTFERERLTRVDGELTLLGVTRPVTLTAERFACIVHPLERRKACGGVFTATINRAEFGMSRFPPQLLAHEVHLRIPVEALLEP